MCQEKFKLIIFQFVFVSVLFCNGFVVLVGNVCTRNSRTSFPISYCKNVWHCHIICWIFLFCTSFLVSDDQITRIQLDLSDAYDCGSSIEWNLDLIIFCFIVTNQMHSMSAQCPKTLNELCYSLSMEEQIYI